MELEDLMSREKSFENLGTTSSVMQGSGQARVRAVT